MSFDLHSELPPHLLALAHLTQWHSEARQLPLEVRFTVHKTELDSVTCALTGSLGTPAPADYTRSATVAIYELAQAGNFKGSYNVRINSSPGGQTIVKQMPLSPAAEQEADQLEAPSSESATPVSNNGLRLRSALLERGHTSGYSPTEVASEEKRRGLSFTPELKFYRALVRQGVVADVAGQEILASTPQADFGASALDSAPWKAPEKTDGTVQAVLSHNLWLEIANSPTHLYAIDLAPGARGTLGQVIARRRGEASVPVRVALSLADFVTGNLVTQGDESDSPAGTPPRVAEGTSSLAQTIAWVGSVEPLALPGFLGWTLAPTESRYQAVLAEIDPEAVAKSEPTMSEEATRQEETPLSAGAPSSAPAQSSEPVAASAAPVLITSATTPEKASTLFTSQDEAEANPEQATTAPQVFTEAPADSTADRQDQEGEEVHPAEDPATPAGESQAPTDQSTSSPLTRAASAYAAAAFPNNRPITSGEKAQSIRETAPGLDRTPASPEQKAIATTIGNLAFGAPKEGRESQSANTGSLPSLAARAKKVSLPSAQTRPQPPAADTEQKQEENALRSALRKFFIGD